MLRWERGQVAAEYVGMLLLVAVVITALVAAGPARQIADGAARAVCQIAGSDCAGAPDPSSADPAAVERAAADLRGLLASDPDPSRVAGFFQELDPAVAEALAREHPELVGNLDGAPIGLRYTANAEAIDREIARLRAEGVAESDPRLAKLLEFDDPDRHFLLFDPAGDGRVAEVFGDLTTARHVAVVVPGMNNDLNNFTGGDAERVQHQASQFDPDEVATIQWLGYDTPEGASALSASDARPGAEDLPQFIAGIRAARPERLHWTVIGHSYGSLVTGMALSEWHSTLAGNDETVLIGSPGVGVSSADDLGDGNVWVGLARFDPVGYSEWHGPNPHGKDFGATRFHTGAKSLLSGTTVFFLLPLWFARMSAPRPSPSRS